MPTTYKKCDDSVRQMANEILCQQEQFKPVLDARVKIDFMFAVAEIDPTTNAPAGPAIMVRGRQVYGQTRVINLRDRAKGNGDVEITLDEDYWQSISEQQQKALLAHELTHIAVRPGKTDDLMRPVIKLRHHDFEVGWFHSVAAFYGSDSIEVQQANQLLSEHGQYYWPTLLGKL